MTTKSLLHSSLLDNQYYTSMLVGNDAFLPSTEDILAEEVLASSQASVTFSSLDTLAAGYQHLQVRYTAGSDTINRWFAIRVNGDDGGNYTWHSLTVGGGGSVGSYAGTGRSGHICVYQHDNLSTVGFSAGVTDILDPFDTSKNTTIRTLAGMSVSPYFQMNLNSSAWLNTAAVDSLTFYMAEGSGAASGNLIAKTRITLIGLK